MYVSVKLLVNKKINANYIFYAALIDSLKFVFMYYFMFFSCVNIVAKQVQLQEAIPRKVLVILSENDI